MRKLLSILTVCIVFTSCSPERVLKEELINKGTEESPLFYHNGKLFTGIEFDVYPNGELKSEKNIEDGKYNGLQKWFYENGQLRSEYDVIDGEGVVKEWHENGQLRSQESIKNNMRIGDLQRWDKYGNFYGPAMDKHFSEGPALENSRPAFDKSSNTDKITVEVEDYIEKKKELRRRIKNKN